MTFPSLSLQVSITVQSPKESFDNHGGDTKGIVWSSFFSYFTVQDRVRKATVMRMQSTIHSVVLQVLTMTQNCIDFLGNKEKDDGTTLPGSGINGTKHPVLYGSSRSLLSNMGWSRAPSPVSYHGAKHHRTDLLLAIFPKVCFFISSIRVCSKYCSNFQRANIFMKVRLIKANENIFV